MAAAARGNPVRRGRKHQVKPSCQRARRGRSRASRVGRRRAVRPPGRLSYEPGVSARYISPSALGPPPAPEFSSSYRSTLARETPVSSYGICHEYLRRRLDRPMSQSADRPGRAHRPDRAEGPGATVPCRGTLVAAVARRSPFWCGPAGLSLDHDRDWPVVDELDLHVGAEHARRGRDAAAPGARRRRGCRAVLRLLAARARWKSGLVPFWRLLSAISVNWLTTSASPPTSSSDRSNFPASSGKMRSRAIFAARPRAVGSSSSAAIPSRTTRPAPIDPPGCDRARATRWTTAFNPEEVADPGGVLLGPGLHRARQLEVAVRLGRPALFLERPAERIVRVVVGGCELLDDRPELALRILPACESEVGDSERLADRRLLGLEPLRLLERNRRLRRHAAAKPLLTLTKQLVGLAH